MADPKVLTKLIDGCIVKLSTIIGDDNMGDPRMIDYRSPDELSGLLLSDLGQRLPLDPLSNVINSDN